MENRTLGTFIAFLRKEKHLTQKQLAELLNVSDKTVSHWECDETSPDISLLPLLAETLGVTVDELLKGEKKSPQPAVEHHYIPPKSESVFDKAEHFATKTVNRIRENINGDITERYRYFRLLSLIGTAISLVVLLSVSVTTIFSGYYISVSVMAGLVALIGSLWTIVISLGFTCVARFLFSKALRPDANADEKEKEYIYKANKVSYNNIFLVLCIFPMALIGTDILPMGANIIIALVFLALLRLVLTVILARKNIIRIKAETSLLIKYGFIFVISASLISGSLILIREMWAVTPRNIIFHNAEDFIAYMETPKDKPDDAWLIDGVSATVFPTMPAPGDGPAVDAPIGVGQIPSDVAAEAVGESVLGYCNGELITFKWLNNEVSDCTYNNDEGTFHVITYEAEITSKKRIDFLEDTLPWIIALLCIGDAAICTLLYTKKIKKLNTEAN